MNTPDFSSSPARIKAQMADEIAKHLADMTARYFSSDSSSLPPVESAAWLRFFIDHQFKARIQFENHTPNEPRPAAITYLPSHAEWVKLTSSIQDLAKEMGIKNRGFGHVAACGHRIEHDYPKVGFDTFLKAVCSKLNAFPVPPLTRLEKIHSVQATGPHKAVARELFILLGGNPDSIAGKLYTSLPDHVYDLKRYEGLLSQLCPTAHKGLIDDANPVEIKHKWLLIFELLRSEQASWNGYYAADIHNSAPTLYSFQDPEVEAALRRILHGRAPSNDQMRTAMRKAGAYLRQRKHRAKISS